MHTPPASIEAASLLARTVSLFSNVRSKRSPATLTLLDYFAGVRDGRWRCDVDAVRVANQDSKADAERLKVKLPAITPSGTFRGLTQADLIAHSGILCLDLDDVGPALAATQKRLRTHTAVLAFHLSPRGTGLKVFLAILSNGAVEHAACWKAAVDVFRPVLPAGVKIDPAPSNVVSKCFVSYDPDTWVAATHRIPLLPLSPCLSPIPERKKEEGVISEESMSDCDDGGSQPTSMSDFLGRTVCACAFTDEVGETSPAYARQARAKAERAIAKLSPPLARIFKNYLLSKPVNRGQRYAFLLKVIPPLFTVISVGVLTDLLRLHHQWQTGTWSSPIDQHMREVEAMITDWACNDYRAKQLSEHERQIYDSLRLDRYREAYRILRDLSMRAEASAPFFMSCAELAARLGCHRDTAHETLKELRAERVIEKAEEGQIWRKGSRPRATSFCWLEPLPAPSDAVTIALPLPALEPPLKAKESAPAGLCPACWSRSIVAPIGGPTCAC